MNSPQMGNCPKCGRLFMRFRDICDDCFQKQEDDYLEIAAYLREYPGSTIQEVSNATEVTVAQIRYFILTGRIIAGHFPNLSYPCETCGNMIRSGRTCEKCNSQIHHHNDKDKSSMKAQEQHDKSSGGYIKKYL